MQTHTLAWAILLLATSTSAYASKFSNQYSELELPAGIACQQNGSKWVCQNTDPAKKQDVFIHILAKIKKGDQDTLDKYLEKLKVDKSYKISKGMGRSIMKYAEIVNYNGQAWVEALHQESELPGYYTYYLETVIQDLAILIAASIDIKKYDQYSDSIRQMFTTIKVYRSAVPINNPPSEVAAESQAPQQQVLETSQEEMKSKISSDSVFGILGKKVQKKADDSLLYLLMAAAGLVGFFAWKKRRKD